jgi:hypothetical protein
VWCGGAAFIIHNYPRQYFDGPAVAEYISDPQLALLVADHQGSLSVDWLSGDAPEMQQWDYIGHLLAELSSERCVALLVPAKETVMPFRPNTIRLLRGPNVLERLGFSE